jgi:hypothetical protein
MQLVVWLRVSAAAQYFRTAEGGGCSHARISGHGHIWSAPTGRPEGLLKPVARFQFAAIDSGLIGPGGGTAVRPTQ